MISILKGGVNFAKEKLSANNPFKGESR